MRSSVIGSSQARGGTRGVSASVSRQRHASAVTPDALLRMYRQILTRNGEKTYKILIYLVNWPESGPQTRYRHCLRRLSLCRCAGCGGFRGPKRDWLVGCPPFDPAPRRTNDTPTTNSATTPNSANPNLRWASSGMSNDVSSRSAAAGRLIRTKKYGDRDILAFLRCGVVPVSNGLLSA